MSYIETRNGLSERCNVSKKMLKSKCDLSVGATRQNRSGFSGVHMKDPYRENPLANSNETEKEIDRAVHRVYKAYGHNLRAFFTAIQNQLKVDPTKNAHLGPSKKHGKA